MVELKGLLETKKYLISIEQKVVTS